MTTNQLVGFPFKDVYVLLQTTKEPFIAGITNCFHFHVPFRVVLEQVVVFITNYTFVVSFDASKIVGT